MREVAISNECPEAMPSFLQGGWRLPRTSLHVGNKVTMFTHAANTTLPMREPACQLLFNTRHLLLLAALVDAESTIAPQSV